MLIFRGVGVNFWHYYAFLERFTREELGQFKKIYATSGASGAIWLYLLSFDQLFFKEKALNSDANLIEHMNKNSLLKRFACTLSGRYVYETKNLISYIASLVDKRAQKQAWRDCRLNNFIAVAHDFKREELLFLSKKDTPEFSIIDSLCAAGLPRRLGPVKFCREYLVEGVSISDFDFSGAKVKNEFKRHLKENYGQNKIVILNLLKDHARGNTQYCRVTNETFPKGGQIIDFALPFLGMRNPRLRKTLRGDYSGP